MKNFESINGLFKLVLPDDYKNYLEEDTYTFHADDTSALQISALVHYGGKQFEIHEELEKTQITHPTAGKLELGPYWAVHYGIHLVNEGMLQYIWITGERNVKLFCTLTLSDSQENFTLDTSYEIAVGILSSLRIFPTR